MRLSPHFTLRELTASQTAARKGIDNMPGEQALEHLRAVCEHILEPVRAHYGIPFSPSSGFRCLELNRAIGSHDGSQHVRGQAVDFEVPGVRNLDLARWIEANLRFDQLILEFYDLDDPTSGWVHCSWTDMVRRGEVLTIGAGGALRGLPEG